MPTTENRDYYYPAETERVEDFPVPHEGAMRKIDADVADLLSRTPEVEVNTDAGTKVTVNGVVIFYDSGWRDLTDTIQNGWGGHIQVKRTLQEVHVAFLNMEPPESAGNNNVCTLPLGFRVHVPAGSTYITAPIRRSTNTVAFASLRTGMILLNRADSFQSGFWTMTAFPATADLPSTLPGTEA